MNWREQYDDPINLAEMLRIEAKWVREHNSAHSAQVMEDAADALEELAQDDLKVLE